FIPLRLMGHLVEAEVRWHQGEKMAELIIFENGETKSIKIPSNSLEVLYGDDIFYLDSPAFLEDNVFYVPVRFVVELLGKQVRWVDETRTIEITHKNN
ncbi:MAG: copper amine oxidase N-terminal domain-containing protein, partial [Bacillota bacterium]|nr:copper amine oxidase N-terminal domain-containing protein [Bacillota bacterium]